MKKVLLVCALLFFLVPPAFAVLTTIEFNDGDSLSGWSTDRSEPLSFNIVNNELHMQIGGELNSNDFYNTQGMKINIGQSNYLSVDMYIDSSWSNYERYGGLWGVGYSSYFEINDWGSKTYPILEYQNDYNGAGVAGWDSWYGWSSFNSLLMLDQFNRLAFLITDSGVEYYINSNLVYIDSLTQTEYFTDVILNAKFEGNPFTVRYDNLTYGMVNTSPVPEPGSLLLFGAGLAGLALYRRRSMNK